MSFRDWQSLTAPPWLQSPNGTSFEAEFGQAKDDLLDRARLGVLARFPGAIVREVPALDPLDPTPVAPSDALEEIGADRVTPRAPSESDAAYAARLLSVWTDHGFLGGPFGLLTALEKMGYASPNIIQDNGRYWYLTAGVLTTGTLSTMITRGRPGWQFTTEGNHDVLGDLWSRFALLFATDAANLISAAGQAILNSIVEKWRPGIGTFMGTFVILANGGFGWPVAQTWGDGSNWGADSSRFIPPDGSPAVVRGP